jgi:hypothetical protein
LKIINSDQLKQLISDKDDVFLAFDALLVDFAALNPNLKGINCEEFKALCTFFDLDVEENILSHNNSIID